MIQLIAFIISLVSCVWAIANYVRIDRIYKDVMNGKYDIHYEDLEKSRKWWEEFEKQIEDHV